MARLMLTVLPAEILLSLADYLESDEIKSIVLVNRYFLELFRPTIYADLDLVSALQGREDNMYPHCLLFFLSNPDCAKGVRRLVVPSKVGHQPISTDSQRLNDRLATQVEQMVASDMIDLSWQPDLPDKLREGWHWARDILLLHVVTRLEKLTLRVFDEWQVEGDTLGYVLSRRVTAAAGDLEDLHRSLPRGLLEVKTVIIRHNEPPKGVGIQWIWCTLLLPHIQELRVVSLSNPDLRGRTFPLWMGKSTLKRLSITEAIINHLVIAALAIICPSLSHLEYEAHNDFGMTNEVYTPHDDITFTEALSPLKRSLFHLNLVGQCGFEIVNVELFEGMWDDLHYNFVGPLHDFRVLNTVNISWQCLGESTLLSGIPDWSIMLPPQVRRFSIYFRTFGFEGPVSDYDFFAGILQAKDANPALGVEQIYIGTTRDIDETLLAEVAYRNIRVSKLHSQCQEVPDPWTYCHVGRLGLELGDSFDYDGSTQQEDDVQMT